MQRKDVRIKMADTPQNPQFTFFVFCLDRRKKVLCKECSGTVIPAPHLAGASGFRCKLEFVWTGWWQKCTFHNSKASKPLSACSLTNFQVQREQTRGVVYLPSSAGYWNRYDCLDNLVHALAWVYRGQLDRWKLLTKVIRCMLQIYMMGKFHVYIVAFAQT